MKYAPIALFVYNRPEHTRRLLETLAGNKLAGESSLFIFADGPKKDAKPEELKAIENTRKLVRDKKWCGNVEIIESDKNKGLADSITGGVTKLINDYGRAIVLEDDLILSEGFLKYMNDALEIYKDEEKAMHIAGYTFPHKTDLPETFFFKHMSCWGWATWDRAWRHFNPDSEFLYEELQKKGLMDEFNMHGYIDNAIQLYFNFNGIMKTWAIKWYASIYLNGGLCLQPDRSLALNLGHDNTGTHCGTTDIFEKSHITNYVNVEKKPVQLNESAQKEIIEFYKSMHTSQIKKFLYKNFTKSAAVRKIFVVNYLRKRRYKP